MKIISSLTMDFELFINYSETAINNNIINNVEPILTPNIALQKHDILTSAHRLHYILLLIHFNTQINFNINSWYRNSKLNKILSKSTANKISDHQRGFAVDIDSTSKDLEKIHSFIIKYNLDFKQMILYKTKKDSSIRFIHFSVSPNKEENKREIITYFN